MMTPFRAWMVTGLFWNVAVMPWTRPEEGLSRTMRVRLWRSRNSTPLARALFSSARTRPDPGLPLIVSLRSSEYGLRAEQPRHGPVVDERRHHLVELDAVVQQEVERRRVLVGPHAHQISIAVSELEILRSGVVQVDLVGRVDDAELLLQACAAAERNPATAHHRVSADVVVLLDDEHRRALIARHDRRAEPGRSGADDDDVGGAIPSA